MSVLAIWPLVIALLGLALWCLAPATAPKASTAGHDLWQIGMLWFVYTLIGHVLKLGS